MGKSATDGHVLRLESILGITRRLVAGPRPSKPSLESTHRRRWKGRRASSLCLPFQDGCQQDRDFSRINLAAWEGRPLASLS